MDLMAITGVTIATLGAMAFTAMAWILCRDTSPAAESAVDRVGRWIIQNNARQAMLHHDLWVDVVSALECKRVMISTEQPPVPGAIVFYGCWLWPGNATYKDEPVLIARR